MSLDVTSLSIVVTSKGIKEASDALNKLATSAASAEKAGVKLDTATKKTSDTQKESVSSLEKLMAKLQKQVDLLGANTSQTNAYNAAMQKASAAEQQMAAMLGAEVDAYKRLGVAQSEAYKQKEVMQKRDMEIQALSSKQYASAQAEAIRMNAALDASYKKLAADADRFYAQQAKAQAEQVRAQKQAQASGNSLNMSGQRAEDYKKLSLAQAEAIRMNNAYDASLRRLESDHSKALEMEKARAYRVLAQAQAEAIRMNNAYDASLRRLNIDQTRQHQQNLNNVWREGHTLVRGLSGSMGALWMTYGSIIPMLAGVAIGASLKEAVVGFAQVEYQMTFVKALAEDTTHSVKQLTTAMHDIAGALGINPEVAAKGLRALTQAGLNTKDALETLPVAFKLATVGELPLEAAALAATGVMNAYGLAVKDIEHIGDVMAKAGAVSAASVDSISVSMKYSAGTAEQYGVSLEKLATTLTLLGKRGITGSSAGVAANNLITEIYSPSTQGAIKAQAALGVHSYVDGVRQTLESTVDQIKKGLAKYDPQSQGILLEAMFGKKGGKAFYAVAQGTKEDFLEIENTLVNSSGFVAEVYKANLATVRGQFELTKSAITNMFSKVGEESAEPIKVLMVSIRNLANNKDVQDMFIGLAQSIKTFVTVVVPVAGIVGGMFFAMKVGTGVVTLLTAAFTALNTVNIASMWSKMSVLLTTLNPLTATLLGVVTLLAGAYFLLHRNQESVHDLHDKEMSNSRETLEAGEKEIQMLEKKLILRNRGIRGESEEGALKAMEAESNIQRMQQKVVENNTRLYDGSVQQGSPVSNHLNMENKQLTKDIAQAEVIMGQQKSQNERRSALLKSIREREKQLDKDALPEAQPSGMKQYGKSEDGAGAKANDIYSTQLTRIRGEVEAGKRELQRIEESFTNKFKAGLISEFDQIDAISDARINKLQGDVSKFQRMIDVAAPKNKGNVTALVQNEMTGAQDKLADERTRREEAYSVVYAKMQEKNSDNRYKQLILQGRNEEAATEKSKKLYETELATNKMTLLESLQQLSVATGPDIESLQKKVAVLSQYITYMQGEADALTSKGRLDDAELKTQKAFETLRIEIAAINAAAPAGGLLAGIFADDEIARLKEKAIPELEKLYQVQLKIASLPDAAPDASKNAAKTAELLADVKKKSGGMDAWSGAQDSIRKYAQEAKNSGQLIGDVMTNAFRGAEDALTNFVMTGKLNFKDFAKSIIADLVRIQSKQMVSGLFNMMGGGGKGGSGGMGMMSNFGSMNAGVEGLMAGYGSFATMNAGVAASQGLSIMDLAGAFADGGDPPVGQVSLVGERGPELFVPKQAGTIIPNHLLNAGSAPAQNSGGGSSEQPMQYTIVNQTTGRIDSVKEQRLSDNERALIIMEAVDATASSLYDTNSRMSKGMRNTHDVQRKR